jgi:hypothetical protein
MVALRPEVQDIQRHEARSVITPPSTGPRIRPAMIVTPQIALAARAVAAGRCEEDCLCQWLDDACGGAGDSGTGSAQRATRSSKQRGNDKQHNGPAKACRAQSAGGTIRSEWPSRRKRELARPPGAETRPAARLSWSWEATFAIVLSNACIAVAIISHSRCRRPDSGGWWLRRSSVLLLTVHVPDTRQSDELFRHRREAAVGWMARLLRFSSWSNGQELG